MRFLSINHLRLGSSPGGIPNHVVTHSRAFSASAVWHRAVKLAVRENVHAVLLSGETISTQNAGLEPWGPLIDGIAELQQAEIPVIAIEHVAFTPANLARFSSIYSVQWLRDTLDWDPVFTTDSTHRDAPTVHVIAGVLAENPDAPANNPITLEEIDYPDSIWILTDSLQPDQLGGEHALAVEPGSAAPLTPCETGRHGAWLIDTETHEAQLYPLAEVEFASIDIDISSADDLDTLERIITASLVETADAARRDGSIAETMLADISLSGRTRLYSALVDTANELQRMLQVEHDGITISIGKVEIDATPQIDLEPLLNRPDPVGEVARLINALDSDNELNDAQEQLVHAAEQKLLAISHARVFGSILDLGPEIDAAPLLRRQGWAMLDALVRQRGID